MTAPSFPSGPAAHDPMPLAPPPADPDACCGEGCAHCVLEMQLAALARYNAELAAWRARQAQPVGPAPTRP